MLKPPLPLDETARLLSLHSLRILDTPSEDRFDRITRMAKRFFAVDTCLVSLVDANRQWFKSKQGLEACETSRDISFCGHAILDDEIFIVRDASKDIRFADNPLVTGEPFIRFYAGSTIRSPDGGNVGTLCLIHGQPRDLSEQDQETLRDLSAMVEDELKVSSQVTTDELTQIANRRGFNLVAGHMLSLCRRNDIGAELVYFDLDGFKQVNDSLGHQAGDEILQHFAKLLVKCFRTADVVARLGGDEFAVLLTATKFSSKEALQRLEKLAADENCKVLQRLAWSVGTFRFDPVRHSTIESLLTDADFQMYNDKVRRRKTGT